MVELKRLNVRIDSEVHKKVKIYAVKIDKTIAELTEMALKEYMEKHPVKD